MISKETVKKKLEMIEQELEYLSEYQDCTFDEIAKDYKTHSFVERIIERIVGFAIDINQHILIKKGKGRLPFDFTKSFLLLADLGVYPKEFAKTVSKSAGLRNILVHEYQELDEKKFYASIKDCYRDYTKYCRYVLEFLKNSS